MIVYQGTKSKFLEDADNRNIEDVINTAYIERTGKYAPQSEYRAWQHSLSEMARVLRDKSIDHDIGVGVEFGIPQTAKRIDLVLTGHAEDGTLHATRERLGLIVRHTYKTLMS